MTDRSFGEYIMLDPMEVPTVKEIDHAIEVLRRCELLFAKMRRKTDPPAGSMDLVSSFLESLVNNYRNKLRRGYTDVEIAEQNKEDQQPTGVREVAE